MPVDQPYDRAGQPGEFIDSYYSRTLRENTDFAELDESQETPVCVIGGGMAGISVALGLVERGIRPLVLESARIGFGASGRNGGFVSPGYSIGIESISKKVGRSQAKELYQLTRDAMDIIRRRLGEKASEYCGTTPGLLGVSWFDQADETRAEIELMSEFSGDHYEFWPQEKVRDLYRSNQYYDGVFSANGLQLHSLDYTRMSARLARQGGAQVFEKSGVRELCRQNDHWLVNTARGQVKADEVVVCCSGYIDNLQSRLARATLSVATYILLTEKLGDRLKSAVRGPYGVSDNRFSSNYYRVVDDDRLFWGGRVSMFNPTGKRLEEIMIRDLLKVYPQLKGVKSEVAWGGYMGYARHKMPQVGQLEPGLWYCQGFGGSGMTTTIAGGEAVAAALSGENERYRLFEPFGLDYAGKPLGPLIAQSAYWLFQVQDQLRSWRSNR